MKSKFIASAIVLIFVAVLYSFYTWITRTDWKRETKAFDIGVDGYIYGYPLVLMNATKQATLSPKGLGVSEKPINTFIHSREFATTSYTLVTSPNVDTLYSNAWLDLSKGPLLLHVPKTTGRYYIMQMLDAWTNVFADPGTRTAGSEGGEYVIVGPKWTEEFPAHATRINSATDMAWINLRIECFGPHDYPAVNAIQDQFTLNPLQSVEAHISRLPLTAHTHDPSPEYIVSHMNANQFFNTMEDLLTDTPPTPADEPIIEKLATINIYPSRESEREELDPAIEAGLEKAIPVAKSRINAAIHMIGDVVNGWRICKSDIGTYRTNYLQRAAIACWALGVNLPEDAVYPFTYVDSDGNHLNGSRTYKIHFDKGKTPPVNAFWSITMYNAEHFLVANRLDRYAIQSHNNLQYNTDGSLDIFIQRTPPKEKIMNWLPCPKEYFNLILRMYWPKSEVLDGTWTPPAVLLVE
jgi:hypothetical protein